MDPGAPPGGFERLFEEFDRIVSAHPAPRQIMPNPSPDGPADEPPWWEPEELKGPEAEAEAPEAEAPEAEAPAKAPVPTDPEYDPNEEWIGPPPISDEERQIISRGDEEASRQEAAEARMSAHLANPNGASFKEDESGLAKAYRDETAPGVYYDPDTRTEFIKGTVPTNLHDWWDDVSKIPCWGDVRDSERYGQADAAYKALVSAGKPVDRVVGHSLGGSVALEMQANHNISQIADVRRARAGPLRRERERYRHPLDVVSILDRGAQWGGPPSERSRLRQCFT